MTMPVGTFSLVERDEYSTVMKQTFRSLYLVGDPTLWQPLLDALAAKKSSAPKPEIWVGTAGFPIFGVFEYLCERCGSRFLSSRLSGNRVRLCSDRCELDRRNEAQRQWRRYNPLPPGYYQQLNANRDRKRAEARAGRTCEHCGVPIEAARSTKRFCSGICRVRAYRKVISTTSSTTGGPADQ
jgi:hypothetical protein